ncbi:hypothetical protein VA596_41610 [Amycolatopsis sp., V23-08]|uniref:Uncharacterized protein n=1 Tax=Amycolatopsis heterodermiae TaxID=3110235 RepID=A0ABU5RKJ0_9PSEU|nr:hypothetical protein [Amycolatopsis sp., V23-08]MEA5366084.1 hypothetical protein [Amycolatopsis sp., V23-08]
MDEEHYQEIDRQRARMENLNGQLEEAREQLHEAIRAAFPETAGGAPQRGVLAEVTRRSGLSREYVAQIRDGKAGS